MTAYILLPLSFLKFWFLDAPISLVHYFSSVNASFFQAVSLPLFIRTFFKPLKNEYREGLVGFSIGMGIVVKSILILIDCLLFAVLLSAEVLFIGVFLLVPIATVLILFL